MNPQWARRSIDQSRSFVNRILFIADERRLIATFTNHGNSSCVFFYLNFRETYIHGEKMRDLMLYVRRRQCCLILNRLKLPFMGFFHFYKNTILVFMD